MQLVIVKTIATIHERQGRYRHFYYTSEYACLSRTQQFAPLLHSLV